jgi:fatty-acyl-CoA synthase
LKGLIAGAPPPPAVIEGCEAAGIELTHVYGLTEVYGPAAVCAKQEHWDALPREERARLNGRQGVTGPMQEAIAVLDPDTLKPVPADGETMGEIFFRGNVVMKGYLKNPSATAEAFAGGWFHTGDLAVMHPDGYVKIRDRSKDIIISGGENISSIEVEDVLHRHPAVMAAAVVALPDAKWGEVPCAFVELKPQADAQEAGIIEFCRTQLARFKVPKRVIFGELPKTSDRQDPEVPAARAGQVRQRHRVRSAMASEFILETRGLTKEFKGFAAVNDVNLKVRAAHPRADRPQRRRQDHLSSTC